MLETHRRVPDPVKRITDPAVAVGNIFLLPVTLIRTPPNKAVVQRGVTLPPTYTAQPPME
jgi:hypothetical protein